ncbi:Flp pilus assembly protein CpaB [Alphaproteobacteria bacterium]|jgi:pilus assembly protein CpaB|nr:Flp pilus assembly protein CpaB [Alphaproteobacteria bacterium]
MRLLVICLVVLAVFGAGGAVILVKKFIDAGNQSQGVSVPEAGETVKTIFVLVADTTLQPGTLIKTASYRWQQWPNDAVTENYFTETNNIAGVPEEIKEFKIRQPIFKGTPITKEMVFKTDTVGVLPGLLKNDMRAMSVSVRSPNGPVGLILPGDKVDVIVTMEMQKLISDYQTSEKRELSGKEPPPVKYGAETILKNIAVIAIDQNFESKEVSEKPISTVTLELSSIDAEKLAVAKSMGNINLVLRSAVNSALPETNNSFTSDILVSNTLRVASKRQKIKDNSSLLSSITPKTQKRRVKKKPASTKVVIYKGGVPTTEYFSAK